MVLTLKAFRYIDPKSDEAEAKRVEYGELFFKKRQRKGSNYYESKKIMRDRLYFGCMMVETGDADAMISGLSKNYPDTIRPALQISRDGRRIKKSGWDVYYYDQKRADISRRYYGQF